MENSNTLHTPNQIRWIDDFTSEARMQAQEILARQDIATEFAESQNKYEAYDMQIQTRDDIPAYFPDGTQANFLQSNALIRYPEQLLKVLWELYQEYNEIFQTLLEKNKESSQDYVNSAFETPTNIAVQIDMTGMPPKFLSDISSWKYSDTELKQFVSSKIFEIENSLAAYSLLRNLWESSVFQENFDEQLDKIRATTSKKVKLLVLSEEKYKSVASFDAWFIDDSQDRAATVRANTWFDDLYGPEDILKAKEENEEALYYVRASLDRAWLKNPDWNFSQDLLSNHELRAYIKRNSVTLNIDNPDSEYDEIVNDSKEYMPAMKMGYRVESMADIFTQEYIDYMQIQKKKGTFEWSIYCEQLQQYLLEKSYSLEQIQANWVELHLKPMKVAYWAFWHVSWDFTKSDKRQKLQKELTNRWSYILQPRMRNSECFDETSAEGYIYIDRIFMGIDPLTQSPKFIGWFRNFMPKESQDGKKWIVHGSPKTVYASITQN